MATRDLDRLAKRVRTHRMQLFASRKAAADSVGISKDTWKKVEEGDATVIEMSYAKIDRALGWATGSCEAIAEGGEPLPVEYVESDGDVTMVSKPVVASAGDVRNAVTISAMATMPEATMRSVQEQAERIVEELKKLGLPIEDD
jgi:DNA-binding XRE family transcriptional regulator